MTCIEVEPTPDSLPWGLRGQRPVRFHLGKVAAADVQNARIPGVECDTYLGIVACAWDFAPTLATYLGLSHELAQHVHPSQRHPNGYPWPVEGNDWWMRKGLPHARKHQPGDLEFMAPRAYPYLANDPRTGKTPSFLWFIRRMELTGALCIVPARTRPGWARETARWLGERALILEGRAGNEMRLVCLRCSGTGWLARKDHGETVRDECPDCEGSRAQTIRIRKPGALDPIVMGRWEGTKLAGDDETPPPDDAFIEPDDVEFMAAQSLIPPLQYGCPTHKYPRQARGEYCRACAAGFYDLYQNTRIVIAHKQIFIRHSETTGEGRDVVRQDLPGWGAKWGPIWRRQWGMAVISEAHEFRGYDIKSMRGDRNSTYDRVYDALLDVPRVACESGTPVFGNLSSSWAPYNLATKGLLGDLPYDFDRRYCLGQTREIEVGGDPNDPNNPPRIVTTWDNSGEDPLAKTELGPRVATWTRRVTRREANPDKPELVHDIVYIDSAEAERSAKQVKLTNRKGVFKETRRLSQYKWPAAVENIVADLLAGYKTYALFNWKVEAKAFKALVDKEMAANDVRARARKLGYYSVLITGDTVESSATRLDSMCQKFQTHDGVALCVATYDQTAGGISLADTTGQDRGPHTADCIDWWHNAFGMLQSITRIDEAWNTRITARHYSLSKTLDAPITRAMLPSLSASRALMEDKGHDNMASAMRAIVAHHAAAAPLDAVKAHTTEDGRLVLTMPSQPVAPGSALVTPPMMTVEVPEGIKADVFARILKDIAGIDSTNDRSYRYGVKDDDDDEIEDDDD